jgi:hypothetical protein
LPGEATLWTTWTWVPPKRWLNTTAAGHYQKHSHSNFG